MLYTVHAWRWGDRENHSYLVGVFSDSKKAILAAESEKILEEENILVKFLVGIWM